jgi:hypothetical protein
MNLTDTRRQNLRIWTSQHGTPVKEKSLFSQLKGNGSFGEKVARRLEQEYDMGAGYLDAPIAESKQREVVRETPSPEMSKTKRAARKLPKADAPVSADVLAEMNVITAREAQLLNWYRMSTESSKGIIDALASTIEKQPLSAIVDDQAEHGLSRS